MTTPFRALGFLVLLAAAACSTAPPSSPDAAIPTATTSTALLSVAATGAGATAFAASDGGVPDPLEALHDAELVVDVEPALLRHDTLRILRAEADNPAGSLGFEDYLAEDGSIIVRLEDRSSSDDKHLLFILHVHELDHPERDHDMIVVDGPDCNAIPDPPPCDRAGAAASTRRVNAFLAKHKWVTFELYFPWGFKDELDDCQGISLARHFRAAGFDFQFREPHLLVTSSDGVVVLDRNDLTAIDPSTARTKTLRTYVGVVGMDVPRRAGWVLLDRCGLDRDTPRYRGKMLFFRLPKPAK